MNKINTQQIINYYIHLYLLNTNYFTKLFLCNLNFFKCCTRDKHYFVLKSIVDISLADTNSLTVDFGLTFLFHRFGRQIGTVTVQNFFYTHTVIPDLPNYPASWNCNDQIFMFMLKTVIFHTVMMCPLIVRLFFCHSNRIYEQYRLFSYMWFDHFYKFVRSLPSVFIILFDVIPVLSIKCIKTTKKEHCHCMC